MSHKKDLRTHVTTSEITLEGFWVHTHNRDYYLTRKKYPWFKDATDEEIRDVFFILAEDNDEHGDMLFWRTIGIDFDMESIEKPELIYHAILVRCVKRPDLFAGYKKGVAVE